jgi:hypothetical protein
MSAQKKKKLAPRLWKWDVPDAICQLPQLNLSCFGCCGYDYASEDKLKKQIATNTWRFNKMYTSKEAFAETTIGVTEAGCCKAVIEFEDGTVGCPLHPKKNDGKDLRTGDCLRNYECNTLRHYKTWRKNRRLLFLEHVVRGNFDTYSYSMANANSSLIMSFFNAEPDTFASKIKDMFSADNE